MPQPTQPKPAKSRLNPWVSILILLSIALAAWALVARNAKTPIIQNQPPGQPALNAPQGAQEPITGTPTLLGTVTFVQGNSLTTMLTMEDNPALTVNRVLIVSYHRDTQVVDKVGKAMKSEDIKVGDHIAVWSSSRLTAEEPILAADKVVVNP